MITVLLPGMLRAEAGGAASVTLDAPVPGTLGVLLDELKQRWPRLERRIRDEQALGAS